METLAYLHLALAHENLEAIALRAADHGNRLKFGTLSWKKFDRIALIHLLSVAIALSILSVATQAQALLKQGSRGAQVTAVQQRLRDLGYFRLRPTGNFGAITKNAVIRFQRDRGLTPDGVIGPATEAVLFDRQRQTERPDYNRGVSRDLLKLGDRSPQVERLQRLLQDAGFFPGRIDGVYGPATEKGVRDFQQFKGLNPDGVAGRQTILALENYAPEDDYVQYPPISDPDDYVQYPPTYDPADDYVQLPTNDSFRGDRLLQRGDRGPEIRQLQRRLRDLGFYFGDLDGIFGLGTEQAVRQFQSSRNLFADGVADWQTLQALGISNPIRNRYVVVVPIQNDDTLFEVQQYVPGARENPSRLGNYVNAGNFAKRESAERISARLRSRGLDARVVYFR